MEQKAQASAQTVNTMRGFARAATIRAVRTMAQTAASLLGAKVLVSDVDWKELLSATIMSGISSILTSVYTGLPETETALPEIVKESDAQ